MFPMTGQDDKFTERNLGDFNYRITQEIVLINQSSLPLGIISMHIELNDQNIGVHRQTDCPRYILAKKKVDETHDIIRKIDLANREYPEVFTLSPYEATDKFAIFVSDFNPSGLESPFEAKLVVITSRGVFSKKIENIHKTSGNS